MEAHNRMTEGSIPQHMIRFAVPLFIGSLFQQLYNTADALIVGNLLGTDALAAVSATGSLVFLIISLFTGISMGAGVAISRYFGAGDAEKMSCAIHTTTAASLLGGVFLTVFGAWAAPIILQWMGTPPEAMDGAVLYIRIFFEGSLGLTMYNAFRGVMQAVGDSKNPLKYLIISSCLNVVLDLLFIGLLGMGVDGAALATIIAQFVSCMLCCARLMRTKADYRLELRKIGLDGPMFKQILNYGLPSGLQNSVIAIANVVVQSNINAFGTNAVAGCGAYSKIEGFAFLPITSFSMALTTFVSQNLGGGKLERAKKGARFGVLGGVVTAEATGLLVYVVAPYLIGAFTDVSEAVQFGVDKAHICSVFFFLLAASHCLSAVLRGAGKAIVPMITMLAVWCVLRVSFLEVMVPIFRSIAVVNWVYPLTWCVSTVILTIYYLKADWVHAFEKQK